MRRPSPETLVSLAVVAAGAIFVLLQLQPSLLVSDTTPAGGDMGAHVWAPAYLRDHLLPNWRITGWTPDWYAGFPAYHYYFPLPSLLIVLLDTVLPYTVAFKLVTVSGLVGLPFAAFGFGRLTRLPFPAPPLLGLATLPFVFDRFHTIWGGNAAATLAGEFSFSIALSLALVFLGVVHRGLDDGRHRALAAGLLAATALSHLIPAAFAVVGACIILLLRRPSWSRWGFVAALGTTGAALAAFWLLPFLVRLPFSNDMGWERTEAYRENLMPWQRTDVATTMTSHLKLVAALAVLGAVMALARRRRGGVVLVALAVTCALAFRYVPDGPIWNARVLPFWYLSLYLLAAVAAAEVILLVGAGLATEEEGGGRFVTLAAPAAALAVVVLAVGGPLGVLPSWTGVSTADRSFVPGWARWNYSGYEGKPAYTEYREVVATMARLGREEGCGRAMWEYEPELDRYGTPMALMLLPYWTDGCIGSMEGLFFESSATVPYHFLNQSELSSRPSRAMRDLPYRSLDVASGVEHLQLLGVRYYMALSPEAQAQAAVNPDLRLLATTPSTPVTYADGGIKDRFWQVYEVAGSELVEPLTHEPVVVEEGAGSKHGWLEAGVDFYQDPGRWEVPLAADGPREWARIPAAGADAPRREVPPAVVSGVRAGDDTISFDVDRPGTPVLVKASYFPNWKVSGATGPWRVTPNLMVVVPTDRHVELRYGRTPVDLLGIALTLLGLAGVVLMVRAAPVRFPAPRPPRRPAGSGDGEGDGDGDAGEEELPAPLARVAAWPPAVPGEAGNGHPPGQPPERAPTEPADHPPTSV